MNETSVVIFAGLIAGLVAVSAFSQSEKQTPQGLRWSLSESWVSITTLVLAWVMTAYAEPLGNADSFVLELFGQEVSVTGNTSTVPLVFGLILILTPLVYRGLTAGGNISRWGFGLTAGVSSWASFTVIIISALRLSGLVDDYPIVPRLLVVAVLVVAVFGAIGHTARSLARATTSTQPWTLP